MEIDYTRPGDITIRLDATDVDALESSGTTMDRNGLTGFSSKTFVTIDPVVERAEVLMDGDADVTVLLPRGIQDLPIRIEQSDIGVIDDPKRERIEWYFGKNGAVIVPVPESS